MTRNEFETLNGWTPSDQAFDYVNRVYMAAGDMDKQAFCKDYNDTLHNSKIVTALVQEVESLQRGLNNTIKKHDEVIDKATREKILVAEKLLEIADDTDSSAAYELAVALAGQGYVTSYKVRHDMELSKQDKEYIISKL